MSNSRPPIINILTYKLDFKLSQQIYNEFQSRLTEAKYLISKYKTYKILEENLKTVELLLALSIFHKRVVANMDAAVKFHGTVTRMTEGSTSVISFGSYQMDVREKNKLLGITMNYNKLIEKFGVPPSFADYNQTNEFLRKIVNLKLHLNNANPKESNDNSKDESDDKIPF